MADQITIDPNIYTGPDESVDWDYIGKAVKLHQESEQNANRRRGQQVFNSAIRSGTPYADALRMGADAGLYYNNAEEHARAEQHIETEKARKERPIPQRVINVRGQAFRVPPQGELEPMMDAPIPPVNPAPIVATREDPITGANIRMNADQLSQEQIKSTLKKRSAMEPTMGEPGKQFLGVPVPFTGSPTYDPVALEKNTAQLKGLRLERESSIPKVEASTNTPTTIKNKAERDALPVGASYIWNGRTYTKQ